MIASLRLPDLVLGVSVRADTTGARQAANDLKKAINQQMGVVGGAATGAGVGAVSAGFGAATGSALAPTIRRAFGPMFYDSMGKKINEKVRVHTLYDAARMKGMSDITDATATASIRPMLNNIGKSANRIRALAANLPETAMAGNALKLGAVAAIIRSLRTGDISGALLRAGKSFWPLLIVALAAIFVTKVLIPSIKSAYGYIRASGAGGYFGEFGQQASHVPVLMRNLSVQYGLMAIELLNLLPLLKDFNELLMRMATAANWAREQKWLGTAARWSMMANPYAIWGKMFWSGLKYITSGIPTTGGVDLGAGRSPKLGGAFLEGSIEAYRTIQGSMQRYAAETARNTKEISNDMKKILARAPAMGVVPG